MTDNGWINWSTESFNLSLTNDQRRLKVFRKHLTDHNLESVNLYQMAVDFMIAPSEHHILDYYEIALDQLRTMYELGYTDKDMDNGIKTYLRGSKFFSQRTHIREQFIDDVTQEGEGWTNNETRKFVAKLHKSVSRNHFFEEHLKGDSFTVVWLNLLASEMEFVPSEVQQINYYEVAMSYLIRLSIGEKEISYVDRDRLSAALYNSVLYIKHQKLTQTPSLEEEKEKETKTMMKIETKHFVNDTNIANFSAQEKIELIVETEGQIRHLRGVNTESKLVAAELAKVEEFLANINALFDKEL